MMLLSEILENTHSMWIRMRLAWGRRRAAPGEPAPPLPVPSSSPGGPSSGTSYPFFYVYDTKEDALRQTKSRNRNKNILPPPGPPETS